MRQSMAMPPYAMTIYAMTLYATLVCINNFGKYSFNNTSYVIEIYVVNVLRFSVNLIIFTSRHLVHAEPPIGFSN